jgi:hypothetical protein
MAETKERLPVSSPKNSCCGLRWKIAQGDRRDLSDWARKLAKQLPRGARPSEAQQETLDRVKQNLAESTRQFFLHIHDEGIEHR